MITTKNPLIRTQPDLAKQTALNQGLITGYQRTTELGVTAPVWTAIPIMLFPWLHGFDPDRHMIDPAIRLTHIHVESDSGHHHVFDVSNMVMNNFIASFKENRRMMELDFTGWCFYRDPGDTENKRLQAHVTASFNLVTGELITAAPSHDGIWPEGWTIPGLEFELFYLEK